MALQHDRGKAFEDLVALELKALGLILERNTHGQYLSDKDIFIPSRNTAILLKTSIRERWKQWDRDAYLLWRDHNTRSYCAFFQERSTATVEQDIALATRRSKDMTLSGAPIICWRDDQARKWLLDHLK